MPLAKLADRAEIRVAQPRHRHKVDALVAGPIDPPRRVDPLAVGIKQKCRHHPRMVGRITPLLVVLRENRPQIQSLANRLPDQVRNVPERHKVLHRGRKQPHLIHVPRAKNLAHTVQRIELPAPCPLRFLLLPRQAPRASVPRQTPAKVEPRPLLFTFPESRCEQHQGAGAHAPRCYRRRALRASLRRRLPEFVRAGSRDAAGRFAGGTEMRLLTAHAGRLYAGNGYWEDRPGPEGRQGAQILVLDRPSMPWQVDHAFEERLPNGRWRDLAVGALAEANFATDSSG